jgi:hypothetical protein
VPIDELVTHRFALSEIGAAMRAAGNVNEALKTLIVFE